MSGPAVTARTSVYCNAEYVHLQVIVLYCYSTLCCIHHTTASVCMHTSLCITSTAQYCQVLRPATTTCTVYTSSVSIVFPSLQALQPYIALGSILYSTVLRTNALVCHWHAGQGHTLRPQDLADSQDLWYPLMPCAQSRLCVPHTCMLQLPSTAHVMCTCSILSTTYYAVLPHDAYGHIQRHTLRPQDLAQIPGSVVFYGMCIVPVMCTTYLYATSLYLHASQPYAVHCILQCYAYCCSVPLGMPGWVIPSDLRIQQIPRICGIL